jgi:hypothetical protein
MKFIHLISGRKAIRIIALLLLAAVITAVFWEYGADQPPGLNVPRLAPAGAIPVSNDPEPSGQPGPLVGQAVQMDVSPPLRDIPMIPYEPVTGLREIGVPGENESTGSIAVRPQVEDPVWQSFFSGSAPEAVPVTAPDPSRNFEGIGNINGVYPPDPNGDIGKNHYVQMVNLSFQIWDKTGKSLYGPALTRTLWSGFGGLCESTNDGDPIVLYDELADRWIMSQFTLSSPYGECVAVSTSGDPTGSYYRYYFQFKSVVIYDYPKLGVWTDAYYLTANRFGSSFQGASAIALERDKMLNGQPARFVEFQTSMAYASLLPADIDGAALPPGGSPNYMLALGSTSLQLWRFKVNWSQPGASTFNGPLNINIAAYNALCLSTRSCIEQPGTSVKLDGIGDRLMHRLVYRNFGTHETLLASHSVNAVYSGLRAGLRWYEVRSPNGTPTIYQQGTYAPDETQRWMPSLAMDRDGNIAMVYSVSSTSVYPGIRYAGRLAGDPLGQLSQAENTLFSGSGSQTGTASRWGDYTMIAIDPVDSCTFWMTNEYMPFTGTGPWKTRIGAFAFPSCLAVGAIQGVTRDATNNQPVAGVQVQAQLSGQAAPPVQATSNSSGVYLLINLPVGKYTLTGEKPGFYLPTQVSNITVTQGNTTQQDLALVPYPYKIFLPNMAKNFTP